MKKILSFVLMLVMVLTMASCGGNDSSSTDASNGASSSNDLESAKAFLKNMYLDAATSTAGDFTRTNVVMVAGVSYKITWTVEVADNAVTIEKGETEDTIKINVVKPAADIAYVLKATIAAPNGSTTELTYNYVIPAYKHMTFAEYMAAEKGAPVTVKGVVSAIVAKSKGNSNNSIYVQDTDGGYYIYGMEKDPVTDLKLEIGMTVESSGEKDIYNGTHEIKSATVEILDSNKAEVKAIDLTETFKSAKDLKDNALVGIQGALVTIKGVEIIGISDSNDSYYMFKLGELETYVRISSSSCPINSDEQKTFIDTYKANLSKSATVTGIVSVYNGNFYLIPATVDAYSEFAEISRSDADKVAAEKENVSVPEKFAVDKEVELALNGKTFTDVKIEWTSDNAAATIKDGKLIVKLTDKELTVKITATLTCGEATDKVEFTVALGQKGKEEKPEGTAYMFALAQVKIGKNLYFTGEMKGNFLATSENAKDAVKVYIEEVTGGVRFYFMKDGERTYIDVHEYTAGKAGVRLTTEPTCVFTKNNEIGTYITNVAGADYYLGTYSTFNTISASKTSYITGENASKIGVEQFIAGLHTSELPKIETKPDDNTSTDPAPKDELNIVSAPKADTAYKFVLNKISEGTVLYYTGEMSSFYLATSTDKAEAADVYLEATEGGFYLYTKNGSAKNYINIVEREDAPGKVTIKVNETATTVYRFDSELKILITTITFADASNGDFYLGTYDSYKTMSPSKTSYISGDNASKIGVSQFPAYLVA
ncbi:MAG: hypothetical protein E7614_00955 [Ruminococcaceae bacterium]|nr:hypothetical protein [Oscillospiraceae bacterium]